MLLLIGNYLEENTVKCQDGRAKLQLKRIDILEKLHSAGHHISYTTLCDHISKTIKAVNEAFIRHIE
ncbi:hypothetical protein [Arcticibacter eurypsychrophilus]|uniref:hypothetical protein n=1 Tax=Arcticibacter eurypsychrophilus TaxID=1434752 RepID=UPI00084D3C21|nr:hypothetical protein [Arcticibacter eurypsychrophilus]